MGTQSLSDPKARVLLHRLLSRMSIEGREGTSIWGSYLEDFERQANTFDRYLVVTWDPKRFFVEEDSILTVLPSIE